MNILYISSYGLKYYTMILVSRKKELISKNSFWYNAVNVKSNDTSAQKELFLTFYWLNSGISILFINFLIILFFILNINYRSLLLEIIRSD